MLYIVDDAADYLFLVKQVFKLFLPQYSLRLFSNGLDLVQHVERCADQLPAGPERPQLIILDVDMPKLNGFQTLERLHKSAHWQSVPVVMMSNRSTDDFARTAFAMGASSFIPKPMGIDAMKKVMNELCHQWIDTAVP